MDSDIEDKKGGNSKPEKIIQPDAVESHRTKRRNRDSDKSFSRESRFKVDVDSLLVDGEKILERGVISNAIYWKSIVVLIIGFIVLFFVHQLGILLGIVSVFMFAYATIAKEILMFVLTDRRIFVRYGILQVDVVDMRFDKIESVELERMLPGFILGYANLVVMGTGQRYIVLPYIQNGVQIRRRFNDIVLKNDDL